MVSHESHHLAIQVFSLYPNLLGKIYSVTFYLSVEDLSDEKRTYMRTLRFPILDFLVSSVQFSVNNKVYRRDFHLFDAPSKLDNAKLSSDDRPKISNREVFFNP